MLIRTILILLLLTSPATAGVNFSMSNSAVEVKESEFATLSNNVKHYAMLSWCTAVIVPGKYMFHMFPHGALSQRISKWDYLEKLFNRIDFGDEVIVIPSTKRNQHHKEVISESQLLLFLRAKTKNITVIEGKEEPKIVIADKNGWEIKPIPRGATIMASSVPVRSE